ncbi:hypothetical protein TNCT_530961 [Trichonephila clavata]|uniref:Uncharacterized protein n=1 Tax=Trichonephila clavata TaxID=2740835 RepID=A0A8X6G589_TRICU|nr:hypothetical protein TNCT_530961 [Trichonephila clavata]
MENIRKGAYYFSHTRPHFLKATSGASSPRGSAKGRKREEGAIYFSPEECLIHRSAIALSIRGKIKCLIDSALARGKEDPHSFSRPLVKREEKGEES